MLPAANDLQADDKESDWLSRVTVFRFSSEVNGKRLWQELMGEMYTRAGLKPRSMIETAIDGRTCYKMDRYGELVLCVPDARTVIEAEATSVPRLLAARRSQGPAAERLRRAGADWDAIVVLALERNRASIIQKMTSDSKNAPLPLMPFLEIAALLDGATLTLNLSGENLLDGRFEATDAQNAAKLEQLLRKALDMAKTQLAALRQRSGKGTSKWMAPTLALGEQALTSIRLSRDANQVRVSLPRTPAVEEAILRLAREAARTALQKLSEPESLDTPEVSYERP
jgi:hypothetical protein